MRTPKEYTENVKHGVITAKMLTDCLYSCNKRAKNWRDKEREYRHGGYSYYVDKYGYADKAKEQKLAFYQQKEELLSILVPTCIHREFAGYERRRIYDYEKEYRKQMSNFVWENCFYDPEEGREVYFGDIELSDQPKYRYYLFYDMGEHSFHTPIDRTTAEASQLPIQDIDTLQTEGHEIADLLSCQFVRKVLRLIETKNYQYKS